MTRALFSMAATAVVTVLATAGSVWAWGDVGHKVVCEIAFHELTDKARAEVIRLVRKDTEFKAFSDSCAWPDHPKQRETEHYINVPRDFGAFAGRSVPRTRPVPLLGDPRRPQGPDDARQLGSKPGSDR